MDPGDPHIHVEASLGLTAARRNMIAETFGLVADLPGVVRTGCGIEAPIAMTSPRPERVTCLPCREHARRQHLRFAEQVERLGTMPGSPLHGDRAARAAAQHRELARRFAEP